MNLKNNSILITGGSTGIGLALAERFLTLGNEVIICGRSEDKLNAAKERFPKLHTKRCDVGNEKERTELAEWVLAEFPNFNVLVNNAGIQQRINFNESGFDWHQIKQEIAINLEAPIHFSKMFIPHLLAKNNSCIINVSSGLAFLPPVMAPVYGATKAGLHSFTFCLRQKLDGTSMQVIEIVPPAVATDLGGAGQHAAGVDLNEYADAVFVGLEKGDLEIGYGMSLGFLAPDVTRNALEQRAAQFWKQMSKQ